MRCRCEVHGITDSYRCAVCGRGECARCVVWMRNPERFGFIKACRCQACVKARRWPEPSLGLVFE